MALVQQYDDPRAIYTALAGTIDLSEMKHYAVSERIYSEADVEQGFDEYLKYVALVVSTDRPLPIPPEVDAALHVHLLFNEDFGKMCDLLGADISHRPNSMNPENVPDADWEYSGYRATFGEPPAAFWTDMRARPCARSSCTSKGISRRRAH